MAGAENWCMNVSGRIFGPYDTARMARFVEERRLAYHSLVAPAGSRDFRPALQFPELRPLFKSKAAAEQAERNPSVPGDPLLIVFGTESGAERAGGVLSPMRYVMPLSATSFLVRSDRSAEALRDALSQVLPSTERALVFACGATPAACHAVSLEEHDRIAQLLAPQRR